mmetsp:Transcript_1743/g.6510  ORF Transcript_1743/g.6510 Transcript_1743/m.6510 type:complete len:95 (+) Transcript_1743:2667-2951(+)
MSANVVENAENHASSTSPVVKELVLTGLSEKKIASLEFGTLDPGECSKLSTIEIENGEMYTSRRDPARNGPLDPRLGKDFGLVLSVSTNWVYGQ